MKISIHKRLTFSAFAAVCALSQPAFGQEANWDGGYIGVLTGYSSAQPDTKLQVSGQPTKIAETLSGSTISDSGSSMHDLSGGLEAGYNHRIRQWLVGIEGDIQYSDLNSSYVNYAPILISGGSPLTLGTCEPVGPNGCKEQYNNHLKSDWYSTLRVRGGMVSGDTLYFATAGLALSRYNFSVSSSSGLGPAVSGSSWVPGWTLGGGFEHQLRRDLTLKAEYLYLSFSNPLNHVVPAAAVDSSGTKYDLNAASTLHQNALRIGLNYHF